MYKLLQGNSIEYFKTNDIGEISLVLTSPSYFTLESKQGLLENEIGYGESKEKYVNLISDVLISTSELLTNDGNIVLIIGRYNDLSIQSLVFMIEDKLLEHNLYLSTYSMFGKGNHEAIMVFSKLKDIQTSIPVFGELQIYDRVGFFGRLNPEILDWAITSFSNKGELVVDPFAGAGSTVIRADKLGRNGLGVELNPKFIK